MTDTTGKVVALLDGSIYSESVCRHAAWIAQLSGAPVELLHVLGRREAPEQQDLSGSIRLGARSALLEELAEVDAQRARLVGQRGRAILEDGRAILEEAGVTAITTRLRHGDIIEAASALEPETRVVVIGKRGEAADFAKGHLGSNLERITRAATRPVLVAARAFQPVEKVMIAFDGGRSAIQAVEFVAASPVLAGLQVEVISVGSDTPDTRRACEGAAATLSGAGFPASWRVVPGRPEEVLSGLVETDGFGLLVMGAYGHSRIRSLMIGSTTTEMLRSCKVPVLLIR